MYAFLASFASYLVKMIILVALGIMGGFIGVKLRQSKNRKEADSVSEVSSEE